MCVVISERFVMDNPSTPINGAQTLICECTILGVGAHVLSTPIATLQGTQMKDYNKSLFTVEAIACYAHQANTK